MRFFDITTPNSNARDLVFHEGPATSPNNTEDGYWQFHLHPNQEDNLLAVSGGCTFCLVNFAWECRHHIVPLGANRHIFRTPPGTFHRSVSDPEGSLVLNQAIRTNLAVEREFRVYNSGEIPGLHKITSDQACPLILHGFERLRVA